MATVKWVRTNREVVPSWLINAWNFTAVDIGKGEIALIFRPELVGVSGLKQAKTKMAELCPNTLVRFSRFEAGQMNGFVLPPNLCQSCLIAKFPVDAFWKTIDNIVGYQKTVTLYDGQNNGQSLEKGKYCDINFDEGESVSKLRELFHL